MLRGKRRLKQKLKNKFIFDVDGTLTPSRQAIDKKFAVWFKNFCQSNDVYLVTGSDRPKTLEQIGDTIYNSCKRVYNCNGNDVWEKDVNIRANDWVLPEDAHEWLSVQLTESLFKIRTGLHFEHRPGMVNFSIVGRNANPEERKEYVEFDTEPTDIHPSEWAWAHTKFSQTLENNGTIDELRSQVANHLASI